MQKLQYSQKENRFVFKATYGVAQKKTQRKPKKNYYKKEKYSWYCSLVVSQIYSGVVVQQDEE